MPTTPEGKVWDAIGDLRRELGNIREGRANQPQHAYAENIAGSSGNANGVGAPLVVCSVTINIPTTAHRVLLSPSVTLQASNNTSEITAAWTTDDPAVPNVPTFGGVLNTVTANTVTGGSPSWSVTGVEFWNQGYFIDAYSQPAVSGGHVPTPGDRVFNLVTYRNAGAATYTVTNARLWVGVL